MKREAKLGPAHIGCHKYSNRQLGNKVKTNITNLNERCRPEVPRISEKPHDGRAFGVSGKRPEATYRNKSKTKLVSANGDNQTQSNKSGEKRKNRYSIGNEG
jgi:hypothetical protein